MKGGSQKVTNDDEGEGGVTIPPKIVDVIYEQPLTHNMIFVCNYIRFKQLLNMIRSSVSEHCANLMGYACSA